MGNNTNKQASQHTNEKQSSPKNKKGKTNKLSINTKHSLVPSNSRNTPGGYSPAGGGYTPTPSTANTQFLKRERQINKILKLCKEEEQHWIKIIDTLPKYDQYTEKSQYIINYWSRQYQIELNIDKTNENNNVDQDEKTDSDSYSSSNPLEVILTFYEPKRGLFNHNEKDQLEAKKLWALTRLEWVQRKIEKFQNVRDELLEYEQDWDTNTEKKKYWRCQICKHSKIKELFIEHEQDTSYEFNYKREICKKDFEFAYNVMMSCKTRRKYMDQMQLCHHSVYFWPNLRKYEVVERFAMHRCRVTNDNHVFKDTERYHICDTCKHPLSKHDQIWCKHADEFDGTEEIVTKKVKGMDGSWT